MLMSPERLLQHFDQIAEAPDAIPHLRRFILDLAVRGKLVEQEPNDEPAVELLKKIQKEKSLLISKGKIQRHKDVLPPNVDEAPCEIPHCWEWACLAELSLKIHYGYTASANSQIKDVRLLRITDIQNNNVCWETVPGCEIADDQVEQYLLADGDILIARTGGTIGKTFLVKDVQAKAVFASYLIRVQISRNIFDRYAKLFLESPIYWKQLEDGSRGAGQPNVNGQTLGKMAVSLPPLAEQHRIVAKVDELMSLCDELEKAQAKRESRRGRLVAATLAGITDSQSKINGSKFFINHLPRITARPDHIKQLRQTILNLAVRGKLVPQNPKDESAVVLLKQIHTEKMRMVKEGIVRNQKSLMIMEPEDYAFDLPETWVWLRLGDIGFTQTGTTPSSNSPEYFGDYIPFIKPAALTANTIDYSGEGISKEGVEHSRLIPKNSVLMVCIGSSIGKVNVTDRDVCCNQQINTVTPYLENLTAFTSFALKSFYFQKLVLANAGMGTLPIISKGKWEILPIPLPPLAEQHRIVAKVNELMALCDELEARLNTTSAARHQLLESTLHEALHTSL